MQGGNDNMVNVKFVSGVKLPLSRNIGLLVYHVPVYGKSQHLQEPSTQTIVIVK